MPIEDGTITFTATATFPIENLGGFAKFYKYTEILDDSGEVIGSPKQFIKDLFQQEFIKIISRYEESKKEKVKQEELNEYKHNLEQIVSVTSE